MKKSFDYAKYAVDEIIGYGFKNNPGLRNTRAVGIIPEKTFKGDLDFHPFKQMLYLHGLKPFIIKGKRKPKKGIYNVDLNDLYLIYPEEDFSFYSPVSLKQISIKASEALDFRKNIMGRSSLFRIISNKTDLDLTQKVIEELSLKGIVAYCDEPLAFRDNDPILPETPKVLAKNKYDSPIILNGTLEALSDYKEDCLINLNSMKVNLF
ncbi:MAG TPA: hypothetical protein HA283_05650 [Nanoarchaeota archaeon]|nr:hypothetical protein [Nanoarchaeota archaeon]HIH63753.1 hypothetical protein [Nanoarchaeota archaeon]HIJ09626.1 hypothetical protein [Nanoarchaeota archaeon]